MGRSPAQIEQAARDFPRIAGQIPGPPVPSGRRTSRRLCPCHDDHDPTLSFSVGKDYAYVWHCHAGCDRDAIREALLAYISEADLGTYRAPRDRPRVPAHRDDGWLRIKLAEALAELAEARAGIARRDAVMDSPVKPASLQLVAYQAAREGLPCPVGYDDVVDIGLRTPGLSKSTVYELAAKLAQVSTG